MRGRGGRSVRGGFGNGFSQQPTDTINIRVSEIQQPVTDDVMRRVFQSVGVSCNSIQITPTSNPQETSVVAQFPDTFAAERVMTSLNNRNIFNNGNKMTMQYTNWLSAGNPMAMGGNGGGILQSSAFDGSNTNNSSGGMFAPQQMQQSQPQPQSQQQQQQPQQMPPQMSPPQQMPPHMSPPQQQQHQPQQMQPQMAHQQPLMQQPPMPQQMVPTMPQQMMPPMSMHMSPQMPPPMPQQMLQQLPQMPPPQQPQPQPQVSVFTNPAGNMMPPPPMDVWYGAGNPSMDMNNVTVGFPDATRGGMMRGNGVRARGRGGRGAYGFDPMGGMQGYMPIMPGGGMGRGGAMMPQVGFMPYQQFGQPATVFVSVTHVPLSEPLQSIFTLMEAFGGVVAIRRNQNKKEILTVKAASPEDALAIVTFMHRVPYAGGQVSGKLFPTYLERYPCTEEGDPLDPETAQYDFTASRHRSPGQRSKAVPSRIIKITGCSAYDDTEVMTYLNGKGFSPVRTTKSDDGTFEVHLPDVATSVKVLLECQGSVCDEEKSNVIFVEGPRDDPTEVAKAANEQNGTQ